MRIITLADNISQNKATKIFNNLCKYTDPWNECLQPYMGGNKFVKNSFSVGMEVECVNRVTEFVLYSINVGKKYLILGKILK